MTLSAASSVATLLYTGPGAYSFLFKVYETSDLVVTYMDTEGSYTTLVLGVDYTAVINSDYLGGTVTVSSPADTDGTLIIHRELPLEQDVDWVNNSPLNAETLERSFDRLTMITQQIQAAIEEGVLYTIWRGAWATASEYHLHDFVTNPDGDKLYIGTEDHTAGTWATDLANGLWSIFLDMTVVVANKTAAQAAQTAAELAETNTEALYDDVVDLTAATIAAEASAQGCVDEVQAVAATVGTLINASVTYTVGAGGDYATLNLALADLSRRRPVYLAAGVEVELSLLSGFVLAEQINVQDIDLSWIRISSVDATVNADSTALVASYVRSRPPGTTKAFFVGINGGLPRIDTLFSVINGVGLDNSLQFFSVEGLGGRLHIHKNKGAINDSGRIYNGIQILTGARGVTEEAVATKFGQNVSVWSGTLFAYGANFASAVYKGVYVGGGSYAYIESANCRRSTTTETTSDIYLSEGIIHAKSASGGINVTANTPTENGIIYK